MQFISILKSCATQYNPGVDILIDVIDERILKTFFVSAFRNVPENTQMNHPKTYDSFTKTTPSYGQSWKMFEFSS